MFANTLPQTQPIYSDVGLNAVQVGKDPQWVESCYERGLARRYDLVEIWKYVLARIYAENNADTLKGIRTKHVAHSCHLFVQSLAKFSNQDQQLKIATILSFIQTNKTIQDPYTKNAATQKLFEALLCLITSYIRLSYNPQHDKEKTELENQIISLLKFYFNSNPNRQISDETELASLRSIIQFYVSLSTIPDQIIIIDLIDFYLTSVATLNNKQSHSAELARLAGLDENQTSVSELIKILRTINDIHLQTSLLTVLHSKRVIEKFQLDLCKKIKASPEFKKLPDTDMIKSTVENISKSIEEERASRQNKPQAEQPSSSAPLPSKPTAVPAAPQPTSSPTRLEEIARYKSLAAQGSVAAMERLAELGIPDGYLLQISSTIPKSLSEQLALYEKAIDYFVTSPTDINLFRTALTHLRERAKTSGVLSDKTLLAEFFIRKQDFVRKQKLEENPEKVFEQLLKENIDSVINSPYLSLDIASLKECLIASEKTRSHRLHELENLRKRHEFLASSNPNMFDWPADQTDKKSLVELILTGFKTVHSKRKNFTKDYEKHLKALQTYSVADAYLLEAYYAENMPLEERIRLYELAISFAGSQYGIDINLLHVGISALREKHPKPKTDCERIARFFTEYDAYLCKEKIIGDPKEEIKKLFSQHIDSTLKSLIGIPSSPIIPLLGECIELSKKIKNHRLEELENILCWFRLYLDSPNWALPTNKKSAADYLLRTIKQQKNPQLLVGKLKKLQAFGIANAYLLEVDYANSTMSTVEKLALYEKALSCATNYDIDAELFRQGIERLTKRTQSPGEEAQRLREKYALANFLETHKIPLRIRKIIDNPEGEAKQLLSQERARIDSIIKGSDPCPNIASLTTLIELSKEINNYHLAELENLRKAQEFIASPNPDMFVWPIDPIKKKTLAKLILNEFETRRRTTQPSNFSETYRKHFTELQILKIPGAYLFDAYWLQIGKPTAQLGLYIQAITCWEHDDGDGFVLLRAGISLLIESPNLEIKCELAKFLREHKDFLTINKIVDNLEVEIEKLLSKIKTYIDSIINQPNLSYANPAIKKYIEISKEISDYRLLELQNLDCWGTLQFDALNFKMPSTQQQQTVDYILSKLQTLPALTGNEEALKKLQQSKIADAFLLQVKSTSTMPETNQLELFSQAIACANVYGIDKKLFADNFLRVRGLIGQRSSLQAKYELANFLVTHQTFLRTQELVIAPLVLAHDLLHEIKKRLTPTLDRFDTKDGDPLSLIPKCIALLEKLKDRHSIIEFENLLDWHNLVLNVDKFSLPAPPDRKTKTITYLLDLFADANLGNDFVKRYPLQLRRLQALGIADAYLLEIHDDTDLATQLLLCRRAIENRGNFHVNRELFKARLLCIRNKAQNNISNTNEFAKFLLENQNVLKEKAIVENPIEEAKQILLAKPDALIDLIINKQMQFPRSQAITIRDLIDHEKTNSKDKVRLLVYLLQSNNKEDVDILVQHFNTSSQKKELWSELLIKLEEAHKTKKFDDNTAKLIAKITDASDLSHIPARELLSKWVNTGAINWIPYDRIEAMMSHLISEDKLVAIPGTGWVSEVHPPLPHVSEQRQLIDVFQSFVTLDQNPENDFFQNSKRQQAYERILAFLDSSRHRKIRAFTYYCLAKHRKIAPSLLQNKPLEEHFTQAVLLGCTAAIEGFVACHKKETLKTILITTLFKAMLDNPSQTAFISALEEQAQLHRGKPRDLGLMIMGFDFEKEFYFAVATCNLKNLEKLFEKNKSGFAKFAATVEQWNIPHQYRSKKNLFLAYINDARGVTTSIERQQPSSSTDEISGLRNSILEILKQQLPAAKYNACSAQFNALPLSIANIALCVNQFRRDENIPANTDFSTIDALITALLPDNFAAINSTTTITNSAPASSTAVIVSQTHSVPQATTVIGADTSASFAPVFVPPQLTQSVIQSYVGASAPPEGEVAPISESLSKQSAKQDIPEVSAQLDPDSIYEKELDEKIKKLKGEEEEKQLTNEQKWDKWKNDIAEKNKLSSPDQAEKNLLLAIKKIAQEKIKKIEEAEEKIEEIRNYIKEIGEINKATKTEKLAEINKLEIFINNQGDRNFLSVLALLSKINPAIPQHFICMINFTLMNDPVELNSTKANDEKFTCDKSIISSLQNTHPTTRNKLQDGTPCIPARSIIKELEEFIKISRRAYAEIMHPKPAPQKVKDAPSPKLNLA